MVEQLIDYRGYFISAIELPQGGWQATISLKGAGVPPAQGGDYVNGHTAEEVAQKARGKIDDLVKDRSNPSGFPEP